MKSCRAALSAVVVTTWMLAARLAAQDVSVGEPGWFESEGIPEVPPQPRNRLRVDYPRELRDRHDSETGYVLVSRYLDARGQSRVLEVCSAYPWFRRAVEEAVENWTMRPARRGGQPVASWFWVPVIFNPAAADAGQSDATPRLLAVSPVIVPPAVMRKLRENTTAWGTVSLDAAGVPVKVALEPGASDKVQPYIEAALKTWRFAPARQAGQPVASELRVAFLFYLPMAPVPTRETPPRALKQETPIYPLAMRRSGMRGEVVLTFVVDAGGKVVNPVVMRSNNPAFNDPAIEAVMKWRFEPARVDGQPVSTRMAVPIVFNFNDGSGRDALTVEQASRKSREKLPEEFRFDVAPKPLGAVQPVYPYGLLRDGRKGTATAVFEIGPTGDVVEVKIGEAGPPEFGLALAAAVETFKFNPALKDGRPTRALLKFKQEFNESTDAGLVTDADLALLWRERKKPESIMGAHQLDETLKPLSRQPPFFPLALVGKVDHGVAQVEFLVDQDGHARLPRIIEASEPAFGYAAVQAVAQWLFEPPKAGGKPTVARVSIPFEFKAEPSVMGTAVGEPPAEDAKK